MEGKITSISIVALVLGASMSELMAKEHQKHEEVRGVVRGNYGEEKKLQAKAQAPSLQP